MKSVAYLVAAAALATAAPASALTFVMSLSGGGANVGGTSDGNVRTYTSTVAGKTLTLKASGWTNAIDLSPDKLKKSYLGSYSGGLGVTSPPETGGSNTHTVDNVGREDFIQLKFDRAVSLTNMYLSVYAVSGTADSDATVFYKNGATAATHDALSNPFFAQFSAIDVPGGSSSGSRAVDVGGHLSDTWLVSAKVINASTTGSTKRNDGFKLKSITLTAPVPEPATWAMMIIGFGSAGAMLRRRRSAGLA